MNPEEISAHLDTHADDLDELTKTYLDLCDLANVISALKKKALQHIEDEMLSRDIEHGETDLATFGMTNPKPSVRVDEKAWEKAVADDAALLDLKNEYEKARFPFMKDATRSPRAYVRRKRR